MPRWCAPKCVDLRSSSCLPNCRDRSSCRCRRSPHHKATVAVVDGCLAHRASRRGDPINNMITPRGASARRSQSLPARRSGSTAAKSCGPLRDDILLRHGADPAARSNNGRTPLHEQVAWGEGSIRTLFAAGADVNAFDDEGTTPLDLALQWTNDAGSRIEALKAQGGKPGSSNRRKN